MAYEDIKSSGITESTPDNVLLVQERSIKGLCAIRKRKNGIWLNPL